MAAPAGFINPTDSPYNAAGNGSGDDASALNGAASDCASLGKDLWLPPGTYRTLDTVTIPAGVNVESWGEIFYDGPSDRPVVTVGSAGVHNDAVSIVLNVDTGPEDWTDPDYVVIRIFNARGSYFRVLQGGFEDGGWAGVEFRAEAGMQCEANILEAGGIAGSRWRVAFNAVGTTGRCRNNLQIGGNISSFGTPPDLENAGAWFGSSDGTAAANTRNNMVWNAAWEANAAASQPTYEMISFGPYNKGWQCRSETPQDNGGAHVVADGADAIAVGHWAGNRRWNGVVISRNGAPAGLTGFINKRDMTLTSDPSNLTRIGAQRPTT